jgi:NAD(P)-dependent dehydrogenase (short-subunit alcohol dehydrogenase family)
MGHSFKGVRLVVVGASAGIGRGVAQEAARQGAQVVFSARRAEQLAAAVDEAGAGTPIAVDVRDPDSCAALVEQAVAELGAIDAIVYATATSPLHRLADSTTDTWAQVIETNVVGAHEVIRAALPHLAPDAVVAVLSSDSVGTPRPGLVPYASSKAALEELLRGWRNERPRVRWTCITVGPTVPTEFGIHFDPELMVELFAEWSTLGMADSSLMATTDVADVIVGTLALLHANPSVNCDHIVLRPSGATADGTDQRQAAFDQKIAGHEIAGHEIAGHEIAGHEIAGHEIAGGT